ncbi:MAG: LamG domain-containing protein [Candidatus Melainabacteria bacterium]|nr:MAG: LamG domain-containing protein [Candidatus Melainabacteria bacterium]
MGNETKAYLNGELNSSATLNLTENSGNSLLYIGSGSEIMKGKVYAIRLYNRALTDEELFAKLQHR